MKVRGEVKVKGKRCLGVLLALVILLSQLPTAALGAGDELPAVVDTTTRAVWAATTSQGEVITQDTYLGKTQLVIFFNIGGQCGSSNSTIANLLQSDLIGNEKLQIIAIGCPDGSAGSVASAEALQTYMDQQGFAPTDNFTFAWSGINSTPFRYAREYRGEDVDVLAYAANVVLDEVGHLRAFWEGKYIAANYTSVFERLGITMAPTSPEPSSASSQAPGLSDGLTVVDVTTETAWTAVTSEGETITQDTR